jgi:two-component system, OmpR family, response regulator
MRVLLVEDDDKLAKDVARALLGAGYLPQRAADGETAWFLGDTEDFVAAILDLGLPRMDGLSVLKRWRGAERRLPVLILTARGSWSEKVEGIDAGADDYLAKPFRMEELLARLRAIIRRSVGCPSSIASVGGLTLDERAKKVRLDHVPIELSPMEYRLFAYLMLRRGQVVTQQELVENVYGDDEQTTNSVEVLIGRLRRKIGAHWIETRRGFGYLIPAQAT